MTLEKYPEVYLYRRIVQAKIYIDSNYTDNIDLENIADEAYFSKFHFIRLFKKIYCKTPYQYLTTVSIKNAMLLLQTNTPVSEVCYSLGFESLSSFSGLFKRVVGLTPSLYITQTIDKDTNFTCTAEICSRLYEALHFVLGPFVTASTNTFFIISRSCIIVLSHFLP